ncbi:hypothetical protein Dimus_003890 [Dionaea muscipula]
MRYVDIGIPANNKGKHSIGCLFWLLARMVLQMRGLILPGHKWDVMVDLFFYREPEEPKQLEGEEDVPATEYPSDYPAGVTDLGADSQWAQDMPAQPPLFPTGVPPAVADDWNDAAVQAPVGVAAAVNVAPPPPSGWE